mgnify:CR=1 FL=1
MYFARCAVGTFAAGAAVALVVACSDKATAPCQSPNLSGTYSLDSIQVTGQGTFTPPGATGTLQLTTTTYVADLDLPVIGAQHDNGTYSACSSGTFSQTSAISAVTSSGSFTSNALKLTIDVTTQGQRFVNFWTKS